MLLLRSLLNFQNRIGHDRKVRSRKRHRRVSKKARGAVRVTRKGRRGGGGESLPSDCTKIMKSLGTVSIVESVAKDRVGSAARESALAFVGTEIARAGKIYYLWQVLISWQVVEIAAVAGNCWCVVDGE